MSTKANLRPMSDLSAQLAEFGAPVVLLAQRTDGFGERMRAILNALALADLLGVGFAFRWEALERPFGQSTPGAEAVFDAGFLERYQIGAEDLARGRQLKLSEVWCASGDTDGPGRATSEVIFIDIPLNLVDARLDVGPWKAWLRRLAETARAIAYAPDLALAREAARAVDLGPDPAAAPVALHLRAGDIVYGPFRMWDHFHFKCCPYPLAQHIAAVERQEGRPALLFGQDAGLLDYLTASSGAMSAVELCAAHGFEGYQRIVFEITLMSRCREIFAGTSGFAAFASWTGGVRRTQMKKHALENDLGPVLAAEVARADPTRVPPLQISFAARWAMLLRDEPFPSSDAGARLLEVCRRHDPDNVLHALIAACVAQRRLPSGTTAPEIDAVFAKGRFQTIDLLRYFAPGFFGRPPLPPQCLETMEDLARRDVPGALFARSLMCLDAGRLEAAGRLIDRLAATPAEHLSRAVGRHLERMRV